MHAVVSYSGCGKHGGRGTTVWLDFALLAGNEGVLSDPWLQMQFCASYSTALFSPLSFEQVQPTTLSRFILYGSQLPQPLSSRVPPLYYVGIIAVEAIGPSGLTRVIEIDINDTQLVGLWEASGGCHHQATFSLIVPWGYTHNYYLWYMGPRMLQRV
ncbi:hypothetical protein EDB89DRAFT_1930614 [Lactarius sanguifluus]|nr:hypothetical protein EDB89DRAFT_1930614 [Lactarius sanguifluus]